MDSICRLGNRNGQINRRNDEVNIQEEIFRSIENLASKNKAPIYSDIPTVIVGLDKGNKYKVKIDGVERIAKDGIGLGLKTGIPVWCHAMNGDINELYIICKR